MIEKDFKEFVTDLCSNISWKGSMRKGGEKKKIFFIVESPWEEYDELKRETRRGG